MNKLIKVVMGMCCLSFAACQTELPVEVVTPDGDGNVKFQVTVPDAMGQTRAAADMSSAKGGLTNINFAEYDLRYQLAVYRYDGDQLVEAITPQVKVVNDYQPVTYSLRLTPGRNYKVVVWADFVKEGTSDDLHYNTADLRNITAIEPVMLNDESRDAYFINKDYSLSEPAVNLVLKRPFAKVRIVTTDWGYENLEMPDNVKVTYFGCKRFTGIDALTGISTSEDLTTDISSNVVYSGTFNKDEKEYGQDYDASENNRTIMVDYLMTDVTGQTPIHMALETLDGANRIAYHELNTDIPIQRNWLTTIIGNTLTTEAQFTVSIDEKFDNQWVMSETWWKSSKFEPKEPAYDEASKTYHIYTKEEFMWLPDNAEQLVGKTVSIENDIDMSGVNWKPIYLKNVDRTYTVLGNNHTLRNFTMDGTFGAVYEYSALGGLIKWNVNAFTGVWGTFNGIMKDLTFENITINGLADAMPTVDVNGNEISHDDEAAYFAGCIGYTGANWSTTLNITNVHAKHVHIEASKNQNHVQNVGGLVGWVGVGGGNTWFRNCSASDVDLVGSQVGGFAGQVVGGRYVGFFDCASSNVLIRRTLNYGSDLSGFIGQINDAGGGNGNFMEISQCSVPEINEVVYIKDSTGEIVDYVPQSKYYGSVGKNSANLKITE